MEQGRKQSRSTAISEEAAVSSDASSFERAVKDRDVASLTIDTIRCLSMDAVQAARSGHPGTPMGLAPLAYALWTYGMRYTSANPDWIDRDRFILSCGHASMLQYAMLHLTGYELGLDDIKAFRQRHSPAAGHPEYREVPGVETTTGPLGQGVANGVGMALAEEMFASRYNTEQHAVVNHRTWVIASDGDLMEGVACEAASLAGHLRLKKLCVFWDDNRITIDGGIDLSFSEDVGARFKSYGWHVTSASVDEEDQGLPAYRAAIDAAISSDRPTLVICRTHIGHGSPNKQDTSSAHGAPLGEEEIALTKKALGWPEDATFFVPERVRAHMHEMGRRGEALRDAWDKQYTAYSEANPDKAKAFLRDVRGELPTGWEDTIAGEMKGPQGAEATRASSGRVLNKLGSVIPALVGGSADLAGSNKTTIKGSGDVSRADFSGRTIHFGIREHAMGGVLNGMALHGGFRPYGGTFLVFSDYMRPSIRLAALMKLPVIYVFTHDSLGVGEDGPTHQPIEHVASLRAMPGLHVVRPADSVETAAAWRLALKREGPTALILTRQRTAPIESPATPPAAGVENGAYIVVEGAVRPDAVLIATGSEVGLAVDAAAALKKEGIAARVVSMPCWEQFESQSDTEAVFGGCDVCIAVEAGASFGWHRWVGRHGAIVGVDRFGASAPATELFRDYGFHVDGVCHTVRQALAQSEQR